MANYLCTSINSSVKLNTSKSHLIDYFKNRLKYSILYTICKNTNKIITTASINYPSQEVIVFSRLRIIQSKCLLQLILKIVWILLYFRVEEAEFIL